MAQRSSPSSTTAVLAVAKNVAREVLRRRSVILFLLLFLVASALACHLPGRADPLSERLRQVVRYGLGIPMFIICATSILLAAGALVRGLSNHTLHLVAVKPIRRWQILLGKLLGLNAINAGLLVLLLVSFTCHFELVRWRADAPASQEQLAHIRTLTARAPAVRDATPVERAQLERVVEELRREEATARLPEWQLKRQALSKLREIALKPGASTSLVFRHIPPPEAEYSDLTDWWIRVEFKLYASSPEDVGDALKTTWEAYPTDDGDGSAIRRVVIGSHATPQELFLPATSIRPDGSLRLKVQNDSHPETGPVVFQTSQVEVLYAAGHFWGNLVTVGVVLLAQLVFLSAVALFGSALFSFQTASLLGFFVYLSGVMSTFLHVTFVERLTTSHGATLSEKVEVFLSQTGSWVLRYLPGVTTLDPLGRLADGRALGWADLLSAWGWVTAVQGGAFFLIAAWYFSRRELAGRSMS